LISIPTAISMMTGVFHFMAIPPQTLQQCEAKSARLMLSTNMPLPVLAQSPSAQRAYPGAKVVPNSARLGLRRLV
jgi:hypothetical protein